MNIVYERDVDALHNHPCAARDAASRESAARNQHAPARSVCFVRRDRPSPRARAPRRRVRQERRGVRSRGAAAADERVSAAAVTAPQRATTSQRQKPRARVASSGVPAPLLSVTR